MFYVFEGFGGYIITGFPFILVILEILIGMIGVAIGILVVLYLFGVPLAINIVKWLLGGGLSRAFKSILPHPIRVHRSIKQALRSDFNELHMTKDERVQALTTAHNLCSSRRTCYLLISIVCAILAYRLQAHPSGLTALGTLFAPFMILLFLFYHVRCMRIDKRLKFWAPDGTGSGVKPQK